MDSPSLPPQRWERPLDVPPGFWKRQLPTRILALTARGDLDELRRLLESHPEYLNKRGPHNRTLLWEAVRAGKIAAVVWLAERGADVDAAGCYNSESGVQITPYCAALYYRRTEIAAYLLPRSAPPDVFRTAFLGDLARVTAELDAQPALLDAEDPNDSIYFTPVLTFAVAGGHLSMIELLLRRGAQVAPYSAQLISHAAQASRLDVIQLLVRYGAEVRAVDSGIFVMVTDPAIFQYLLSRGAPAAQPGKNGFPPLVYVARGDKGEHPERVRWLLEAGARVDAPGPKGRTALHYAAAAGFVRVIRLLLDHGANLNARDEQGQTALGLAHTTGKDAVAALLAQRGAVE